MRPVSARFLRALEGSHKAVTRARVCTTFQTGTNPTGTVIDVIDGSITFNARAKIRGTGELIVDPSLAPYDVDDLLTPYGNELFIERGIEYGNGQVEYVSQGYFRIKSVDHSLKGEVRVSFEDRFAGLEEARLEAPLQYASTTTYETQFGDLIEAVYSSATTNFDYDASLDTIGRSVIVEEDRLGFLLDMAKARGKQFYCAYNGEFTIEDYPDASATVWNVTYGRRGTLVSLSRELSREGVYNAVVATGEGTDDTAPVVAVARDNNPDSVTYYYGTFGKVTKFYSSPFITTQAHADAAAEAELKRSIGLPYNVELETIVNPALQVNDPIRIKYEGGRNAENHFADQIRLPLGPTGSMQIQTREVTGFEAEIA